MGVASGGRPADLKLAGPWPRSWMGMPTIGEAIGSLEEELFVGRAGQPGRRGPRPRRPGGGARSWSRGSPTVNLNGYPDGTFQLAESMRLVETAL